MALSPEEAKKLNFQDEKIVNEIECTVDEKLRSAYAGVGSVTFSVTDMPVNAVNAKVRTELIARYKKAGWGDVTFDGIKLILSPSAP